MTVQKPHNGNGNNNNNIFLFSLLIFLLVLPSLLLIHFFYYFDESPFHLTFCNESIDAAMFILFTLLLLYTLQFIMLACVCSFALISCAVDICNAYNVDDLKPCNHQILPIDKTMQLSAFKSVLTWQYRQILCVVQRLCQQFSNVLFSILLFRTIGV